MPAIPAGTLGAEKSQCPNPVRRRHFCSRRRSRVGAYARQRAANHSGLDQSAFTERKLWNVARVRSTISRAWRRRIHREILQSKNVANPNDSHHRQRLADEPKALNKPAYQKMFNLQQATRFNSIVSRLKRTNQPVFVGGYIRSRADPAPMRDQGLQTVLWRRRHDDRIRLHHARAEGTAVHLRPRPANKPTAKAICREVQAKNIHPEGYTLYTYPMQCVQRGEVGSTRSEKRNGPIKAGEWHLLAKMAFDPRRYQAIDYVVYKWDAKGNYAEINPKGSKPDSSAPHHPTPVAGAFLLTFTHPEAGLDSLGMRTSPTQSFLPSGTNPSLGFVIRADLP